MMTMPKGGARIRSGPARDPRSGRSERTGFSLSALPSDGFQGDVPALTDFLPSATPRHEQVWAQLWSTPQAAAWSLESWRWPIVADLVKYTVRSEPADAAAGLGTVVRQLRDDCGLSKAGLVQNGWAIAAPAPAEVDRDDDESDEEEPPRRRLSAVPDA